ncbi:MAG: hypothetical protein EBR82_42110 [Caulobacteraceae bacterium]|nr:hypothetical protein [Caulobacteraceae bacterium]
MKTESNKMADYKNEIAVKLLDGTEARVKSKGDAVSIGDLMEVKQGDNFIQAPEGKYELEGGLCVYTDKDGFINEIETEQKDNSEPENNMGNNEMEELFSSVEKLMDVVYELKQEIETIKKFNSSLNEEFKKFSSQPQEESIINKNKPVLEKNATKQERLAFFSSRK